MQNGKIGGRSRRTVLIIFPELLTIVMVCSSGILAVDDKNKCGS